MNRSVVTAVLVVVAIAGAAYWWWSEPPDEAVPGQVETAVDYREQGKDDASARTPQPPQYPIGDGAADASASDGSQAGEEGKEAREPLPALEESDDEVRQGLAALTRDVPIEGRLVPSRLIQKFVVWVNSLDGQMVPVTKWPVEHVPGRPLVEARGDGRFTWLPANADRYQPYVQAFTTPSVDTLADFYLRYYPLLQKAFVRLGEEEDYFNDRVIEIIDHLLQTPSAQSRYLLVQPEVLYQFADPDLEALSSGQKILLRLGPEHSRAVRETLRAFRSEVLSRTASENPAAAPG